MKRLSLQLRGCSLSLASTCFLFLLASFAPIQPMIPRVAAAERIECFGCSILPPQGETWVTMIATKQQIIFSRRLTSPTHTFVIRLTSVSLPFVFQTPDNFLVFSREARKKFNIDPSRHRLLAHEEVLSNLQDATCTKYHLKTEDSGALEKAGDPFLILDDYGYSCLHPNRPDLLIQLTYSQRGRTSEIDDSWNKMGEEFIRDFRFSPLEASSKENEDKAHLEMLKTSVRNAYCGDPVKLSCMGESESTCQAQLDAVVIPACSKKFLEQMATTANDADRERILTDFAGCLMVTHFHVKYRDWDLANQKLVEWVQCQRQKK